MWAKTKAPPTTETSSLAMCTSKIFEIIHFVGVDALEPVSSEVLVRNGSLEMIF